MYERGDHPKFAKKKKAAGGRRIEPRPLEWQLSALLLHQRSQKYSTPGVKISDGSMALDLDLDERSADENSERKKKISREGRESNPDETSAG